MAKSINHLATADNLFFGKGGSAVWGPIVEGWIAAHP